MCGYPREGVHQPRRVRSCPDQGAEGRRREDRRARPKAILAALSERDEDADICLDEDGKPEPDSELRDHELVPLKEDWRAYLEREVTPLCRMLGWMRPTGRHGQEVGRVGYEINFNRYFYRYVPPRPLDEIDAELKALEARSPVF